MVGLQLGAGRVRYIFRRFWLDFLHFPTSKQNPCCQMVGVPKKNSGSRNGGLSVVSIMGHIGTTQSGNYAVSGVGKYFKTTVELLNLIHIYLKYIMHLNIFIDIAYSD